MSQWRCHIFRQRLHADERDSESSRFNTTSEFCSNAASRFSGETLAEAAFVQFGKMHRVLPANGGCFLQLRDGLGEDRWSVADGVSDGKIAMHRRERRINRGGMFPQFHRLGLPVEQEVSEEIQRPRREFISTARRNTPDRLPLEWKDILQRHLSSTAPVVGRQLQIALSFGKLTQEIIDQ